MISPEREKNGTLGGTHKQLKVRKFFAPHALKGQKLLAQGSALGYFGRKPVAL